MWTDSILSAFARRRWRGLRSLLRLFKGGSLPPLIGATTRDGFRFELDPLNYMDALILDEGYFEREVLDALLPSDPTNRPRATNFLARRPSRVAADHKER